MLNSNKYDILSVLDIFVNKKQNLYKYLLTTNYMNRNKKEVIITNIQNEYFKRSRYLKSNKGSDRSLISKSKRM
jgi:hypothetical protein